MAVEARYLNLFTPQIASNRGLVLNGIDQGDGNMYGVQIGYGMVVPSSRTMPEHAVPVYSSATARELPVKSPVMNCDSLLPNTSISKKRTREAINTLISSFPNGVQSLQSGTQRRCGSFAFLGEDISLQIQQQQFEIDRFIAQHIENVRLEIEDRGKRFCRRIAAALEDNIMKRLKAKDDEIEKIVKLNSALEERVKSLCVENQIWRDLAQTNEATANALRSNLELVLAQIQDDRHLRYAAAADLIDDAQSCGGSNSDEIRDDYSTPEPRHAEAPNNVVRNRLLCRRCEKEESCVLLLPCRHLCLCTVCGSTLITCPVCHSSKTASVHVNLSS